MLLLVNKIKSSVTPGGRELSYGSIIDTKGGIHDLVFPVSSVCGEKVERNMTVHDHYH
jgi:hypothetical protein